MNVLTSLLLYSKTIKALVNSSVLIMITIIF